MSRTIHPTQIVAWIQKIEKNLEKFNFDNKSASKEEKLEYIRYQRHLFEIIKMALSGKVYFVGTAQDIRFREDDDDTEN